MFKINPALDPDLLHREYRDAGRIHIADFLRDADAERLHDHLRGRPDWRLIINQQDKLFELDREAQAALSPAQKQQLDEAVYQAARSGFQYRYESIRAPDSVAEREAGSSLLHAFARFMSSAETLDFLRSVTGLGGIAFADMQATAYGPRHFLTAHDDHVEGKHRFAAYVYNLTRDWRADWGGLLAFHDGEGHVDRAYCPRFNAINLFTVPQPHSVTYVVPYVPRRRYSVTGWLRSLPEDDGTGSPGS